MAQFPKRNLLDANRMHKSRKLMSKEAIKGVMCTESDCTMPFQSDQTGQLGRPLGDVMIITQCSKMMSTAWNPDKEIHSDLDIYHFQIAIATCSQVRNYWCDFS